jgi:hypothetical protein
MCALLLIGYSQADAANEYVNKLLFPYKISKNEVTKDPSVPGSRLFLDYKNGFRDLQFGDPIEKLSEDRLCKNEYYSYQQKPLGCTRKIEYGSIVSMPIHDVKYIFHEIDSELKLTGIKIYLHKSPKQFDIEYKKLIKDKPRSPIPDSGIMKWENSQCRYNAKKLVEVWGMYTTDGGYSDPIWQGSKVKARLGSMACSVLSLYSIPLHNSLEAEYKNQKKIKIENEF